MICGVSNYLIYRSKL